MKAFTLMEVMVVIILLVVVASFAIPNYTTSINRTRVRDAVSQLSVLNAANAVYRAQASAFYPGTGLTIDAINSGLNINLIANSLTYSYTRSSTTAYTATAVYGSTFTVRVNESAISSTNPCCSAGDCYSIVPAC